MESIWPLLGIAMCAIVMVQFGMWIANSYWTITNNRKQFHLSQQLLRAQIEAAAQSKGEVKVKERDGRWNGFRPFRVAKLVKETEQCTSVYLVPTDGKPIAPFSPGQHLTLRFDIPGQDKQLVRCYSLSQGPGEPHYRISVKSVPAPHDKHVPPGLVSTFVNRGLIEGDLVEVKAPSGHFKLDTESNTPVALLAGGIGVTPMVSMLDYVAANQPNRQVVLIYGSRHGQDHAFKSYLRQLREQYKNIHVIDVYSTPNETDQIGRDYLVAGYIDQNLIKKILPNVNFQFYLCGPPPFMESVFNGLIDWGVPESRIQFEAFGPASVKKSTQPKNVTNAPMSGVEVEFAESGNKATWDGQYSNLLEFAEANGVNVESGCRAGSCGTCETRIKSGKVKYEEGQEVECQPGHCLTCVAKPDGPVSLEA